MNWCKMGNRSIALVDLILRGAVVLATGLMLFVICLQVFFRFFLNDALPWPEEAARFLMVWSLFLAAVYAQRDGDHVRLLYFSDKLPKKAGLILNIILNIGICLFMGVVLYGGIREVTMLMPMKTGALRISRSIPYLIMPISGVLFISVTVYIIWCDAKKLVDK